MSSVPISFNQHALAAALASGGACSGATAARLHRLRGFSDVDVVEVSVLGPTRPKLDGVSVRRRSGLRASDLRTRSDGIAVTSVPLVILDLAFSLGPGALEEMIHHALSDRRMSPDELTIILERLGGSGRTGSDALRRYLHRQGGSSAATRSRLEARLLVAVRSVGLPEPVVDHLVVLPGGVSRRIDLAWPAVGLGAEVDHPAWHAAPDAWRATADRSLDLGLKGWWMVHLSDRIVERRPHEAAQLLKAKHQRLARDAG